ncbi:piriformospora indica-insensitive protein 2 isoform X2 [Andrographis paniculata]|uniref:piriformospora indica-insensitive protein 2 isoform X2 n=1 Tax=Andrographis paniculata TaxID=175694 RepID=UPI0021E6DC16|nr:piriformospora indica-insensitive protein 2 isoform X2 [Andrographis paniculata]
MAELGVTGFVVLLLALAFEPGSVFSLSRSEQEAVYAVLEGVNSAVSWRSLFPDDLCSSAPHGVVCDFFTDSATSGAAVPHVIELSFGYVSDYSPNPPCGPNPNFDPLLLLPLTHLKKLFFFRCFTESEFPFPDFSPLSSPPPLEELVFIENPSLVGTMEGRIGKLQNLRRLIVTGSEVSGSILTTSNSFDVLSNLEQLTLSRNKIKGEIAEAAFESLRKLKILDLSYNEFQGTLPDSIGKSGELLKLDLSYNGFSGRIPEALKGIKNLEFLDLSYNNFTNDGVPLFLSEMSNLREVYLSGNLLGGEIPEIWGALGGVRGVGLSGVGLVGNIPRSMGLHLGGLCYLGLDNNMLEGEVPEEFGGLSLLNELNLENNNLSGRLPFSAGFVAKLGGRLKMEGNLGICIDEGLRSAKVSGGLKVCRQPDLPKTALFHENSCSCPWQRFWDSRGKNIHLESAEPFWSEGNSSMT